jgi:hypothetical protein
MAVGSRIWQRPLGVAWVSGGVGLVVVVALLVAQGRGVSGFVHAAPPFVDRASTRGSLEVLRPEDAFDGMFYYRMAVSPFSDAHQVAGIVFDTPALRSARMGYPLLGFVGSAGDADLVPYSLIVVNVLAMFGLGWVGGALARDSGRAAMWGVLLPLFPGFVYTLGFDLTELVTALSLAGAVLALRTRHTVVAAVLATYAVLTRETAAVLALALVATWLWRFVRDRPVAIRERAQLIVGIVPLAVAVAVQFALREQWGVFPIRESSDTNVVFPLQGFFESIDRFGPTSGSNLFRLVSLAFLVFVVVVAALSLRRSQARLYEKVAFLLGVLVAMLPNHFIWEGATSFVRGANEAYLFAIIVVLGARFAIDRVLAGAVVAMFGLTFVSELSKA